MQSAFSEDALKKSQWQSFICKIDPVDAPKSLADAVNRIVEFLNPIVAIDKELPMMWKGGKGWQTKVMKVEM